MAELIKMPFGGEAAESDGLKNYVLGVQVPEGKEQFFFGGGSGVPFVK